MKSETHNRRMVPYTGEKPYVFISYPHTESAKVTRVLRLLHQNGIRFWYDDGIQGAHEWKKTIDGYFQDSSMFVSFLSNGVEQRREVMREIEMAIQRYGTEGYPVLFIFLERMSPQVFADAGYAEVATFIGRVQHLLYEGITEEFVQKLFGKDVFEDALVEDAFLKTWQQREQKDLASEIEEAFQDNPYIYETAFPELDEEKGFYKVRQNQVDPTASCLICLDNQWCPVEFYEEADFWNNGFLSEEISKKQSEYQVREIFRALLHHKQLIINRAFFYNSNVLRQWYEAENGNYEAFSGLLSDGSILVFLMQENAPYNREQKPGFVTNYYDIWGQVCEKNRVYCLRMDWTDAATNRLKMEQLIFRRFQDFCLTMAENSHLLEDMGIAFQFDEKQKRDFNRIWREIQLHASVRDRDEQAVYTRERFYKKFLVKKGTDVSDCILDGEKEFVTALKEIVDFQYGLNLPEALGVQAIYPPQGHLKEFYRSTERLQKDTREISTDELLYAVSQFVPDFLAEEVVMPVSQSLELQDVYRLRCLPEWKKYIRAVTNGGKRARIQEIDFYDISFVWERYQKWMQAAMEQALAKGPADGILDWQKGEGAVSVIFQLGNYEVTVVYHSRKKELDVKTTLTSVEEILPKQDHTVLLTVDYVCADVLRYRVEENPLLAQLRLFEGITKEKLSVVYGKLLKKLCEMPHCMVEDVLACETGSGDAETERVEELEQKQLDIESYEQKRYLKAKSNSQEWLRYVELMRTRPEQFQQNEMLTIETELEKICAYERAHGRTIGVCYDSPYSMMVVDLVRDGNGNCYPYERIIPKATGFAVVCVPVWKGKFVLLKQFRHAMRTFQFAFPRGYGEDGLSGEENARKELREELGARVLSVKEAGTVVADSGLSGNRVKIYRCEIEEPQLKKDYEGICEIKLATETELKEMAAAGMLDDGYTLAALEVL